MPVTRKGAGGANASTRMRFSGPTTAMKERRRREDTRIAESVRKSRSVENELASINKVKAEEAREKRERHRERYEEIASGWIVRLRRERCR